MRRGSLTAVVTLTLLAAPAAAHADGELIMRGVWYKEKATRVIQPMLDARFDVGDTAEIDVHTLVDSITSASVAAGVGDTAVTFSERRYELGAGYRQRFGPLRLGGSGRVSHEPDYDSIFGGASAELELFDKNLLIGVSGGLGSDAVDNGVLEGGMAVRRAGTLSTSLGSLSISQIVSRNSVVGLTYDISYLSGFLENPYRRPAVGGSLVDERHPDSRLRHAAAVSLRHHLERTGTTAVGSYRLYRDDWDMTAHTPELRLVQEAGDGVELTVRYRYHWQSAAEFYMQTYPGDASDYDFVSDDTKLSAFTSHTMGVKLAVLGHVLGLEGRFEDARGEIVMEYVDQNNRFGNAVIAHAALTLPFEY